MGNHGAGGPVPETHITPRAGLSVSSYEIRYFVWCVKDAALEARGPCAGKNKKKLGQHNHLWCVSHRGMRFTRYLTALPRHTACMLSFPTLRPSQKYPDLQHLAQSRPKIYGKQRTALYSYSVWLIPIKGYVQQQMCHTPCCVRSLAAERFY
jgi:hypothetical protein